MWHNFYVAKCGKLLHHLNDFLVTTKTKTMSKNWISNKSCEGQDKLKTALIKVAILLMTLQYDECSW